MPPPSLPEYEFLQEIGRGSFGVVRLARHRVIGRLAAIKELAGGALLDPEAARRFEREARALAAAQHPNVIEVYALKEVGHQAFLIMEYVPGPTLRASLAGPELPPTDRLRLVRGLADALSVAHARGVLHRDVKPSNVLIAPDGIAKLGDFGLARIADPTAFRTALPSVAGTRGYIAPEVLAGGEASPSADTYAFAVLAFETLTGRRPTDAPGRSAAVTAAPLVAGAAVTDLLVAALDPGPVARPPMAEISAALERAGDSRPRRTKGPSPRGAGPAGGIGSSGGPGGPASEAGTEEPATDERAQEPATDALTDQQTAVAASHAGTGGSALGATAGAGHGPHETTAPPVPSPLPPIFDPGPAGRRRSVRRGLASLGVMVGVGAATAYVIATLARP